MSTPPRPGPSHTATTGALRGAEVTEQDPIHRPLIADVQTLYRAPVDEPDPDREPERRKPCCVKHLYVMNRADRRALRRYCPCRGECGHHGRAAR